MAEKVETCKLMVLRKDDMTLGKPESEPLCRRGIVEDGEIKILNRASVSVSFIVRYFLSRWTLPSMLAKKIERLLDSNIQDKDSMKVLMVENLDTGNELDKDKKEGHGRYLATLSMMASKIAYESQSVVNDIVSNQWKMKLENFYNDLYNEYQKAFATQAFIFRDETSKNETTIVIAFRGTSPFEMEDWCTDLNFAWCGIPGMPGKVHLGFMTALGLKRKSPDNDKGYFPKTINHQDPKFPLAYYTIRDKLKQILKSENNNKVKFVVTGHSLGGALATIFPAILALHDEVELLDRFEAIYTFGQPRVGDKKFGDFMEENLRKYNIKYYRIVYGYDLAPTLPLDCFLMRFKHFGTGIHFNDLNQGKIIDHNGQFINEEMDEEKGILSKGFGLVRDMTKTAIDSTVKSIKARMEVRKLLIKEFTALPENKKGWMTIVTKIVEILAPQITSHSTQYYVNAIREASHDLFHVRHLKTHKK